jgi:hypothetical protein
MPAVSDLLSQLPRRPLDTRRPGSIREFASAAPASSAHMGTLYDMVFFVAVPRLSLLLPVDICRQSSLLRVLTATISPLHGTSALLPIGLLEWSSHTALFLTLTDGTSHVLQRTLRVSSLL